MMKLPPTKALVLGSAALLIAMIENKALPARQHLAFGVIANIDFDSHRLTLTSSGGEKPLVFVWNTATRFSQGWSHICASSLEPGQSVKVYYRREAGQLVPREVRLGKETSSRCTTEGCCSKGNGAPPRLSGP